MKGFLKKAVSSVLVLALAAGMSATALANEGTTTVKTAYKDLSPRT